MTILLKPISLYQEFDPYDIDVDNRPLLDIQENLSTISSLLGNLGYYSDISADPSQEPPGGFIPFTCACVYSNNQLVPIDISNSIFEIDYTTFPIVLILDVKNTNTNTYPCLFFSAGLALTNKFTTFVPGSQGRLLRVGPGGELVDQMYYDLAHGSKNYQSLYVGKILSPTSIVFGGNQVSILGNNFYLAKNRNDTTSGLITIQRNNNDSNVVFKSLNVNSVGSPYTYAEFTNSYNSPVSTSIYPVPVYFSSNELEFNQVTGTFTSTTLEANLNELHFSTPSVSTFTSAAQTYLTAGINVRSLLDFASINILHAPSYSNNVSELIQGISTRLYFIDRVKELSTDPDIPIGVQMNSPIVYIGDSILSTTNQPANLLPTTDSTGVIVGDYFNSTGAYIGGIQDNASLQSTRMLPADDANNQSTAIGSNGIIGLTTNGINDYSNSFTLLIATKSNTTIPTNIAINTDGYLNLSSGKGILTNAITPQLDLELTSKSYVDGRIMAISKLDQIKIPLTGTNNPDPTTGSSVITPVTGSISFDVTSNSTSTTQTLIFKSSSSTDILSNNSIKFYKTDGTTLQTLICGATSYVSGADFTAGTEVVTRGILASYVAERLTGTGYVTVVDPQTITGDKTFQGLVTLQNDSTLSAPNMRFSSSTNSSLVPIDFVLNQDNTLTIDATQPILLSRGTLKTDPSSALTSKGYIDSVVSDGISNIGPAYLPGSVVSTLKNVPALPGLDKYGYYVIGEVVTFWAFTKQQTSPFNDKNGGDSSNPEYTLTLPPGLFNEIFSVQAQILNAGLSGNAQDWFTQVFNITTTTIGLKYQSTYGSSALSPLQASILVIGHFGSMPS